VFPKFLFTLCYDEPIFLVFRPAFEILCDRSPGIDFNLGYLCREIISNRGKYKLLVNRKITGKISDISQNCYISFRIFTGLFK
jgi:hypothetical protein